MNKVPRQLKICAIIAAHNEAHYLKILLPILADQKIDVWIIDNGSTDDSFELYSFFKNNPIISIKTIPYKGMFSLTEQLIAKQEIYKELKHDWVIHHDADEILEHLKPKHTLRDAIEEADSNGYNAINFEEFVFLPEPMTNYFNRNYYIESLRYYFFRPGVNRLNRAFKLSAELKTIDGGHRLSGNNLLISPTNHILRHYIVLSEVHAKAKYLRRSFSPQDLEKGWHSNRLNFTESKLCLPNNSNFLFVLNNHNLKNFCKESPAKKHFWEW